MSVKYQQQQRRKIIFFIHMKHAFMFTKIVHVYIYTCINNTHARNELNIANTLQSHTHTYKYNITIVAITRIRYV